ncbi:MAG: putative spermidine/putrescine transport system ATP-binding protein [Chloroflexota bacterium]|jgi:putative spermidine/putrescine transport system ATP-binding protein|nr:putative spermidine/putrescine transport system ATP-binding protein [Chloroflexota bacterium]
MNDVSLSSVSKTYGAVRALAEVTLSVEPGELVALLGPSGCGKTTLLRVIAGLARPDAGRVTIGGIDMTDAPTRERPIGMVFQSYALFPNLTVGQNIAFPLEVRHRPAAETRARVAEMLELVNLEAEADRYPNEISGGEAQRCALARALAPSPQVLLLDEPLSALDALVRARLRDEIRRVQRVVRTTTIYVTHDQSEALAIADRVAVMNRGRIEQVATPVQLYADPATEFSAGFVGGRNAVELPVLGGRIRLGQLFDVAAPQGADGRATCFFGPEDVRVEAAGGPGHAAAIEVRTFHGSVTRLHLVADVDGTIVRLHADVPSRRAQALDDGARVSISVDPSHVRTFAVRS